MDRAAGDRDQPAARASGDAARLAATLALIDAANAADPNREDGEPAALRQSRRMSETLAAVAPAASAQLRIAARGHHVERWTRPRADWPEGRAGYLGWREALKRLHADRVAGMMAAAGWPEADRDRVAQIIRREGLKRDPEVQTLEDVACLVFMRWEFAAFAARHDRAKVLEIVRRTGRKMSAQGRAAALALDLPEDVAAALRRP